MLFIVKEYILFVFVREFGVEFVEFVRVVLRVLIKLLLLCFFWFYEWFVCVIECDVIFYECGDVECGVEFIIVIIIVVCICGIMM